jgi:phosphate-selective porin
MCRRFACALFCASLLIAAASAAPAAANATTAPAPAAANATAPAAGGKKVGKVGEPCAQGGACATGVRAGVRGGG